MEPGSIKPSVDAHCVDVLGKREPKDLRLIKCYDKYQGR